MKEWIKTYWDKFIPEKDKKVTAANRKRNWFFLLSAVAFFCLTMENKVGYVIGILIAFGIYALIAGQIPSVWEPLKQDTLKRKLFYGITAAGICLGNMRYFYRQTQKLLLPEQYNVIFLAMTVLGAVIGFYFVYACVAVFWRKMGKIAAETDALRTITRGDKITMAVLFVLLSGLVIYAFSGSEGFVGTKHLYAELGQKFLCDIIYTSDTPAFLIENVYFALTHSQNDLRQPLFAVFASPFLGFPYLIACVLSASEIVQAIVLNLGQLVLLLTANYMLSKMLKLSPGKRIVFMILSSCTYAQLLFTLMMEQYIVAYFWLIFCIYQICEKRKPDTMVMWGAGGALLTSMILLPAMSEKHPVKQFKDWFLDMLKCGLGFVGLMLIFCRFDTISILFYSVSELSSFTGKHITLLDKFFQYTEFIRNCFTAPNAGVDFTTELYVSWQLAPVTSLNWIGIGIFVLAAVSAVWNWKNKSSRMAALWVGFSVVMLFVLGWGTAENGLILYSLYFGWAFLVLLFQLVERIEETLRIRHLTVICGIAAAGALLAVNIPAIFEMIRFAIAYYPA